MATFDNIVLAKDRKKKGDAELRGKLEVNANGLTFTPAAASAAAAASSKFKPITIPTADITGIEWSNLSAGGSGAKVLMKGNGLTRFVGFRMTAVNDFTTAAKAMGKDVKVVALGTKGANWGQLTVKQGNMLSFESEGAPVFDLPLALVAQSVVQGKNEVSLEMHDDDDSLGVMLTEMRVYVPPKLDLKEDELPAVEAFRAAIVQAAELGDGGTPSIATFEELMFATPRGKYTIELAKDYFKLVGKSFNYKLPFATIGKLFLMSLPGEKQHEHLVISLTQAIRQGRTSYPFLIMTIPSTAETHNFKVNLTPEEIKTTYHGAVDPVYPKSKTADLVARMFKVLADKKVLVPSSKFTAAGGGRCVRCSLKAGSGFLFFFEKSFFFVPKPSAYLPFNRVDNVEFRRLDQNTSNRNFDLVINMKGSADKDGHVFTNVDRAEHGPIFEFLSGKGIKIVNQKSVAELLTQSADPTKRAKRDVNYNEDDPYMSKLNSERGDEKDGSQSGSGGGGDDDDDDEEDDDFVAPQSGSDDDAGGEGEDSSSDDSGDDSATGDDDDDDKPKKKAKAKAAGGKRKRDSDDDSDDGGKKKGGKKAADKSGGDKKSPKKKAPAAPRGKSAFLFFSEAERVKIKADPAHKDIAFTEVGKLLGERWNKLTADQKKPFEALAEKDKQRAAAERAANGGADAKAGGAKKSAKAKDGAAAPKRPRSTYMFFVSERKPELTKQKAATDPKSLRAMFEALPAKDKAKYENMHLEDSDRFHKEMQDFKAAHPEAAAALLEKKKKKKKGAAGSDDDDDADAAPKKPTTATIKKPPAKAPAKAPAKVPAKVPAKPATASGSGSGASGSAKADDKKQTTPAAKPAAAAATAAAGTAAAAKPAAMDVDK